MPTEGLETAPREGAELRHCSFTLWFPAAVPAEDTVTDRTVPVLDVAQLCAAAFAEEMFRGAPEHALVTHFRATR